MQRRLEPMGGDEQPTLIIVEDPNWYGNADRLADDRGGVRILGPDDWYDANPVELRQPIDGEG